jgi:hypothetical protein
MMVTVKLVSALGFFNDLLQRKYVQLVQDTKIVLTNFNKCIHNE